VNQEKKIQELVSTLRTEHQRTKTEMLELRETNKNLFHKSVHEENQHDTFIKQIADLKKQILELEGGSKDIEKEDLEISDIQTSPRDTPLSISTNKRRFMDDYDDDIIDNDNTNTNINYDEDEDERDVDGFLKLYERHQTPRLTTWSHPM